MTKMVLLDALQPFIAAQQPGPPAGGGMPYLFPVLMIAAMYFLLIAPQRKKQKEHDRMLKALVTGDEIVTAGGVYGQIVSVKEDRFIVRVSENTKVELGKSFVTAVVKKADGDKK